MRREPNNRPGCYAAVAYCMCLNNYTCTSRKPFYYTSDWCCCL